MAQGVKGLALTLQLLGSLMGYGFDPWLGHVQEQWAQQKKRESKTEGKKWTGLSSPHVAEEAWPRPSLRGCCLGWLSVVGLVERIHT